MSRVLYWVGLESVPLILLVVGWPVGAPELLVLVFVRLFLLVVNMVKISEKIDRYFY